MKFYFTLAWRNIWRNKKRTWITASSIGFAIFFACVMQSMQLGSYERMIDNSVRFLTGHLAVHQLDYWDEQILDNSFEYQLISGIEQSGEIEVAVPRITSFALASYKEKTKGAMITGVDLEKEAELTGLDEKLIEGEYTTDRGVLVAEGLAEYLKLKLNDTIVFIGQGYHGVNAAGKYAISGILKFPVPELNQSGVYMSLEQAQYFYGAPGMITSLAILLKDPDNLESVQAEMSEKVNDNLEVMNWQEMMPELIQGIELDYYGGLIMIFILYAVIGFGIFGTFLMMTKERTYEFGIVNSVGMKKFQMQIMVAMEILVLTFFGVGLGLAASMPLLTYFYNNPIVMTGESAEAFEKFGYEAIIPFSMDPSVFINQGISILIIALFLGLYPMFFIKNLKIIKALRE